MKSVHLEVYRVHFEFSGSLRLQSRNKIPDVIFWYQLYGSLATRVDMSTRLTF